MRIAWATDLHLNHASPEKLDSFRQSLIAAEADALLVSGDFAESLQVFASLEWLVDCVRAPIYFCLGNQDFYFDSVVRMRASCQAFCQSQDSLTYLTDAPPIELAPGIGLIGHDGWADGRSHDYETSLVNMHDSRLIEEFVGLSKFDRWTVMKRLSDESCDWLNEQLPLALERWPTVFLVTHVPPLRQACWYEGGISDRHWAPHFVNRAFGETLIRLMRRFPNRQVKVLCGHTHGEGYTMPLPNVGIFTGRAEYGSPCIAKTFEV